MTKHQGTGPQSLPECGWGRRFAARSEAGFTPNLGAAKRRPQPHKFEFGNLLRPRSQAFSTNGGEPADRARSSSNVVSRTSWSRLVAADSVCMIPPPLARFPCEATLRSTQRAACSSAAGGSHKRMWATVPCLCDEPDRRRTAPWPICIMSVGLLRSIICPGRLIGLHRRAIRHRSRGSSPGCCWTFKTADS